ncbi:hypothetical protein K469DRAFT_656115 [Zopfia rhizophila CBS 207.26]|uniref:Zn(2)-C6 fungal-type domain-containing protein n=1 Tax=Zopfia rhizophila CBS 207.26 TaxID=1314779 RepID=A0A6A6EKS0_9PEZI|nr:hypothetical protein K469DRAFT_656115 [Zopfia rhizophila CBS 207.26]
MPNPGQGVKRKSSASIDGDEKPLGKRSRVSRACDQCRVAREKCDGIQPVCFTCATSNRACSYTANQKKRGIQPGYIRTLELTLAWLFDNGADTERLLNTKLAQEGTASELLGKDTNDSNKLHKKWRKSKFCKDIDKLLSGAKILGPEGNKSPESDEQDSDAGEKKSPEDPTSASSNIASRIIPGVSSRSVPLPPGEEEDAQPTTLPANIWRLFDVYFSHTQCWFPISEKHDVLKISYSYPTNGLHLSASVPGSGDHAELWSIFALASLQDMTTTFSSGMERSVELHASPQRLYNIARNLIPNELGAFQLGHVKALLILSLFNLSQSIPEAAWLLVGHAARILTGIEAMESRELPHSRFKHVFAGCFMLETILSMQLKRRSHLQPSDLIRIGKINEDGLEEWQPWTGCLDSESAKYQSIARAPVLSLSSFNRLVEIVGIISMAESFENPNKFPSQEIIHRLEAWKASLPPTFDYIRGENASIPSTPPAMVLQLVYRCSTLLLQLSSQPSILGIIELLERSRDILGLKALPPVVQSLLELVGRNRAFDTLDHMLRIRFQKIRDEFIQVWGQKVRETPIRTQYASQSRAYEPINMAEPTSAQSVRSFGASDIRIPTPDSLQVPCNSSSSMDFQSVPPPAQNVNVSQFEGTFGAPTLDHRNSTGYRDIESFFDELASLEGAERLENQPQFMQNLGFAPDADIADLLASDFGHFNPLMPTFMHQGGNEQAPLNQTSLFDGSEG